VLRNLKFLLQNFSKMVFLPPNFAFLDKGFLTKIFQQPKIWSVQYKHFHQNMNVSVKLLRVLEGAILSVGFAL